LPADVERVMPAPLISVVVPTYNRADLLAKLLADLLQQTLSPSSFEVIVVDNNSTDRTPEVVDELASRTGNLRGVFEPAQGHSHARNRGWREAEGEWIVYFDDDTRVPATYLENLVRVIETANPSAAGGPSSPVYDVPKPDWYDDRFETRSHGDEARPLLSGEFLVGHNIVIRADVFEQIGGFDPEFGMVGRSLGYADEIEFQERMRKRLPGALIYYDPTLAVNSVVPLRKMSLSFRTAQVMRASRDWSRCAGQDETRPTLFMKSLLHMGRGAAGVVWMLMLMPWRRRTDHPHWKGYVLERVIGQARYLGMGWEGLRGSVWRKRR
jgi:glucosyl-dolichyl phosphate glucuronosyltransferase